MGNSRQHSKPVILRQIESLCHPGEVVCQREVAALHTLGSAFGATGKGEGRDRVGTNQDTRQLTLDRLLRLEAVLAIDLTTSQSTVVPKLESRHFCLDAQVLSDEFSDLVRQLACLLGSALDLNEEPGARDFQVYGLAVGRVLGIEDTDGGTGLQSAHVCHDEVDTAAGQKRARKTDAGCPLTHGGRRP